MPPERRLPAKEHGLIHQNLLVMRKAKGNLIPDDLHLQSPARRPVVRYKEDPHGPRAPVTTGQCLLCRQMSHFARDCPNRGSRDENQTLLISVFGSFVAMVHDRSMTLITKPEARLPGVDVEDVSSSILLFLSLMGLFVSSQFCSSRCPRCSANHVFKECTTNTQISQQTSTDSGFKSKIMRARTVPHTIRQRNLSALDAARGVLPWRVNVCV